MNQQKSPPIKSEGFFIDIQATKYFIPLPLMIFTKKQLAEVKKLLSKSCNIVIVTHWSPDGDAMGSSLGLYSYLKKKKHKVTVITPNDYPSFLWWLPGNDAVIDFSKKTKEGVKAFQAADVIFTLDFNSLKRIEKMAEHITKLDAVKILIDHHQAPESYAKYNYHRIDVSSTCELIYEFISDLGDKKMLDKDIATCLYTGILTDTGSFKFASCNAKTHKVAAELIDKGAVNWQIHANIFDDYTADRIQLLGYCLSEKLVVLPEYNAAYITLTNDELKKFNHKKGDTEGIVNYALSIRGMKFAAFFVERDNIIKASFRSKEKFDVNQFARKHYDGGGHINAAGGSSTISMNETIKRFLKIIVDYKKELNSK